MIPSAGFLRSQTSGSDRSIPFPQKRHQQYKGPFLVSDMLLAAQIPPSSLKPPTRSVFTTLINTPPPPPPVPDAVELLDLLAEVVIELGIDDELELELTLVELPLETDVIDDSTVELILVAVLTKPELLELVEDSTEV